LRFGQLRYKYSVFIIKIWNRVTQINLQHLYCINLRKLKNLVFTYATIANIMGITRRCKLGLVRELQWKWCRAAVNIS